MIPTFGNTASVSEVVAALRSTGAAIVTSAASSGSNANRRGRVAIWLR